MTTEKQYAPTDYIPMSVWSKDHISTMAYVETVMVDCGGFQVGADARMRSNRRNDRVMTQQCPRPKRSGGPKTMGITMSPEHGTRLKNGQRLDNHDDWACLQDAAEEGLFTVGAEGIEPGEVLHLSEKGLAYCAALRAHKATGGNFASFVFSPVASETA